MAVLLHSALAEAAPGGGGGSSWSLFILMGLIFVVIYFMMIRPQRKQAKERESMIEALKKNDHVLTTGGIFGIVDKVKEKEVVLKIDEKSDARLRVAKNAIVGVVKDSGSEEKKEKTEPEQSKK